MRTARPPPSVALATVLFLFFKGATGTTPALQTVAFNQGLARVEGDTYMEWSGY